MKLKYLTKILSMIILLSCGKGTVDVTNESYEPKIAIEGFLIPHNKVEKIRISRNFRINANLDRMILIPDVSRTSVTITDLQNDKSYPLTFHIADDDKLENYYWEYNENDLVIDYGKSYRLDVSAVIEGKTLHATSTTTVPEKGLKISNLNYPELAYRQHNGEGALQEFELTIDRSPGTQFYLITMNALEASVDNFIYDNPFFKVEPEDIEDDIGDFRFQYNWLQDAPTTAGHSIIELYWILFWFYSEYEIMVFAADKNYREFLQTYNDVQEEDGNFHEAKFNIDGDGIGVFGSVVTDTVYIKINN